MILIVTSGLLSHVFLTGTPVANTSITSFSLLHQDGQMTFHFPEKADLWPEKEVGRPQALDHSSRWA